MRYEDASGTFQASGPIANDDSDTLTAGSRGPATGNVITGEGTQYGSAGADSAAGAQVTALAGKGGALGMRSQFQESADMLRKAIAIDKSQPVWRANLAGVYLRLNRRAEALAEATLALVGGLLDHPVYKELGLKK